MSIDSQGQNNKRLRLWSVSLKTQINTPRTDTHLYRSDFVCFFFLFVHIGPLCGICLTVFNYLELS